MPLLLSRASTGCKGNVSFVVGGVTLGGALKANRSGLKEFLTLKLLFNFDI